MLDTKATERAILVAGLGQANIRGEGRTYLDQLLKHGITEEHFTGYERVMFKAALSLHQQGRTFSSLDLIQSANSSAPESFWCDVRALYESPPDIDPFGFLPALKESLTCRKLRAVNERIRGQLESDPHNVSTWLPAEIAALQTVADGGRPFTTDPREIYLKAVLPVPFAGTGFKVLDDLWLGGYRYGDFISIVAVKSSGKSTMCYSLVAKAVYSGLPVCWIQGERPNVEATLQILKAMCGDVVSKADIENQSFMNDYKAAALQAMSDNLHMFPCESRSIEEVRQIVAAHDPALLFIDPFASIRASGFKGEAWRHDEYLAQCGLEIAGDQRHPCALIATFQLPSDMYLEWLKTHNVKVLRARGSAAFLHKATLAMLFGKHHSEPNMGYGVLRYRTRRDGEVNIPFNLPFSEERESFYDESDYL